MDRSPEDVEGLARILFSQEMGNGQEFGGFSGKGRKNQGDPEGPLSLMMAHQIDSRQEEMASQGHEKGSPDHEEPIDGPVGSGDGPVPLFFPVVAGRFGGNQEKGKEIEPGEEKSQQEAWKEAFSEKKQGAQKSHEEDRGLADHGTVEGVAGKKEEGDQEKKQEERGTEQRPRSGIDGGLFHSRPQKGEHGKDQFRKGERNIPENAKSQVPVVEETVDRRLEGPGEETGSKDDQEKAPKKVGENGKWGSHGRVCLCSGRKREGIRFRKVIPRKVGISGTGGQTYLQVISDLSTSSSSRSTGEPCGGLRGFLSASVGSFIIGIGRNSPGLMSFRQELAPACPAVPETSLAEIVLGFKGQCPLKPRPERRSLTGRSDRERWARDGETGSPGRIPAGPGDRDGRLFF